jgi:hypothetical protein
MDALDTSVLRKTHSGQQTDQSCGLESYHRLQYDRSAYPDPLCDLASMVGTSVIDAEASRRSIAFRNQLKLATDMRD